MKNEKVIVPGSGYLMLIFDLLLLAASIASIILYQIFWVFAVIPILLFILGGFVVVNPNDSMVLVLFGKYIGTVKQNGFFWVNPFYSRKKITLRARNLDSEAIKVNDKLGNPIMIGVVVVWKVSNTFKAAFDVDNFEHYVRVQSDASIRKLAVEYSYDNFDEGEQEITLRSSANEVNAYLEKELTERLAFAGIEIIEARINHLSYAPEIAGAMLRRQQATAIVAARTKIVEGAVSMVDLALDELSKREVVELDEEKKATMVSNLMVVLCSDKDATPVLNTGTLTQ